MFRSLFPGDVSLELLHAREWRHLLKIYGNNLRFVFFCRTLWKLQLYAKLLRTGGKRRKTEGGRKFLSRSDEDEGAKVHLIQFSAQHLTPASWRRAQINCSLHVLILRGGKQTENAEINMGWRGTFENVELLINLQELEG